MTELRRHTFFLIFQDSVPLRIKNIHIVNQPYIFKIVFALFKPFLKEKLRNRIIFHGSDRKSLHQYINPKCLPECYGGTLDLPRIEGSQWLELLEKCDNEYKGELCNIKLIVSSAPIIVRFLNENPSRPFAGLNLNRIQL